MGMESKNTEYYEKRFGIIAIEKGYITSEQLIDALTVQVREDVIHGTRCLVGEIFIERDVMMPNQIEEVMKAVFQPLPDIQIVWHDPDTAFRNSLL